MGYLGKSVLGNDRALEWLRELSPSNVKARIKAALCNYIRWNEKDRKASSQYLIDHLASVAIQTDLEAGKFPGEECGPVEEALAAAELVCCWNRKTDAALGEEKEAIEKLLLTLRRKHVPEQLRGLSIAVVEKALFSERYQRMRKFYLNEFPDVSGSDDPMAAIRILLCRLESPTRNSRQAISS